MPANPRPQRGAVAVLLAGTASIALGYALAFFPSARTAGAWALALGLAASCPALIVLAVAGRARRPRRRIGTVMVALGLMVAAGFGWALTRAGDPALLFGLPRATAVMLLMVGVVPLVVLPVVFALTFDDPA